MLWQNKSHHRALYVDRRQEPPGTIPIRPNWSVQPDVALTPPPNPRSAACSPPRVDQPNPHPAGCRQNRSTPWVKP